MLKQVTIARNPLEPDTWTKHQVEDVCAFLVTEFDEWPSTARIYQGQVSDLDDVTPSNEQQIDQLQNLPGPFVVVVYPAEPMTILYVVVAIVAVAAAIMASNVPNPALRNTQSQSPNNELSDRTNKPRPLARIPDPFGTVRSTPDLLAQPYTMYHDHEEVEYAYMCIGRGSYGVNDIKDDTTQVIDIPGTSVEVYGPFTSPNSGDVPELRLGDAINTKVFNVVRTNSVNGQVLRPPNDQNLTGLNNIYFQKPNMIRTSAFDFTDTFAAGDLLYVSGASVYQGYLNQTKTLKTQANGFRFQISNASSMPAEWAAGVEVQLTGATFSETAGEGWIVKSYDLNGGYNISSVALATETGEYGIGTTYWCSVTLISPEQTNPNWTTVPAGLTTSVGIRLSSGAKLYDLNGTYDVLSVAGDTITLSNPAAVNPQWVTFTSPSPKLSPVLYTTGPKWIGSFNLDKTDTSRVVANFVALNGVYKENSKNQLRFDVTLELEVTPINPDGSQRAPIQIGQATIEGSATFRSTRAVTLSMNLNSPGRVRVRARRVTPTDLDFEGTVVDEVKWKDVYGFSPVTQKHFGDVTTVQSVTFATQGALAIKDRKLNMLVQRRLPNRAEDWNVTDTADGWVKYSGGIIAISNGVVRSTHTVAGSSYGALFAIPVGSLGDTLYVVYNVKSMSGGQTIRVNTYSPTTGIGSTSNAVVTTATGQRIAKLIMNKDVPAGNNHYVAFYVNATDTTGEYFDISQIEIRRELTNQADLIFMAACFDPHIGYRPKAEVDVVGIRNTIAEVSYYFGHPRTSEFCYTFDSDNLSFEETAQSIANAVFCTAYRRGSTIQLKFEKETENSLLLFNHRNKIPGSENRTVGFGNKNNYDGVNLTYVSPEDDAVITYYIPEDRSARNSQKVETLGIRNGLQAYLAAWRSWNKIQYQNVVSEFQATQEADLLIYSDRILVADNTRTGTQDGEVLGQDVLQLTLSQPTKFESGAHYTMFVQLPDGTVEAIGVTSTSDPYKVVLSGAPRLPLSLDAGQYARAIYMMVSDKEPRGTAFLISEKKPQTNMTVSLTAYNYDSRYYGQDKDFVKGVVNSDGTRI
jgi:hypothetical protein